MGKDLNKIPRNSVERKKNDVRKYSKLTLIAGTVAGVALLSWLILSTSFIWVVLWGAAAGYGALRVSNAIK